MPKQKAGKSDLAAGTENQIGVWEIGGVEVRRDFVDIEFVYNLDRIFAVGSLRFSAGFMPE